MRKSAISGQINYVIAIIIGLILLAILFYFMFASPGGPSNMTHGFLDFLGQSTSDIETSLG